MPECAKTHLQQFRISKFSGEGPPDPPPTLQGEGREEEVREERGKGKGRREGKDMEGRGGTGRDRGGKEGGRGGMGVVGRGGALDQGSARPPRDKLWIRPCFTARQLVSS